MQRPRRDLLVLLGFCLWLPISALLAFFLAGAVAFPIVEPYYAGRIFISFGLMAVVYGVESIIGLGVIETCGFLSGNCSTHNLYSYAIQIWQVLIAIGLVALLCTLAIMRNRSEREPGRK